jgi:2-oxoglutarate ferredoxin oxidoreductase subunit alpha
MQSNWGSHGDYEVIVLCPQSSQEAFDLTIDAFNLSETYRVPVLMLMDERVAHTEEEVVIPDAAEIDVVPRRLTDATPADFKPYKLDGRLVPEFARAGDGYRFHTTGLTHDARGYPVMSADVQRDAVGHLMGKIQDNADTIMRYDAERLEGADVVVLAYGVTAGAARKGIELARERGVQVGFVRPIVIWPFPEERIRQLATEVKAFVVPEINYGQIAFEVERCAAGQAEVVPVPHGGGGVHDPQTICEAIVGAAK